MRIAANGITFNCAVEGADGAPWLVFSNSLATNLHMWDPQADDLKRSFRILRYDQRGHGATDAPAGRYSFATLVADALALFDALGIARPHFFGLSMGGATALGLAELHPDRVDRVVVCDSPAMSTPAGARQWEERIAVAQTSGMAALEDFHPGAVVSARNPCGQAGRISKPCGEMIRRHAGQRLRRRLRPRSPTTTTTPRSRPSRGRCCSSPDRRTASRRPPCRICMTRLPGSHYVRARRRRPHFQSGPAGGVHQGDEGVSRRQVNAFLSGREVRPER